MISFRPYKSAMIPGRNKLQNAYNTKRGKVGSMNSNETKIENTQETNESPQGERLFTASEVEAIVKKRVARIKTEKARQEGSGPSPAAEDLEKRLADITKREAEITKREAAIKIGRASCRERVSSPV